MCPFLESGSAEIYHQQFECQNKTLRNVETIILVHGLGMDNRYWYKILPVLMENFHIVTFDLRGHGESSSGDEDISWEVTNMDLFNLVKKLNLMEFHLIGHGLGANLAIQFAYFHPNFIKTLTIISTIVYFPPKVTKEVLIYRKHLSELEDSNSLADYLVPKILLDPNNSPDTELLYSSYRKMTVNRYFQYYEILVCNSLNLEQISQIYVPTLILSGEFDPIFPSIISGLSAFAFPNNHYIMIPNTSNGTFLDQPVLTVQAIINFIVGDSKKSKNIDFYTPSYIDELDTHMNYLIQQGVKGIESHFLQVKLFNSFSVRFNGKEILDGWNMRMAKRLFTYLIFHRSVQREQVCDDLFNDVNLPTAKRNLRVYLHHLKRLLNQENRDFLKTDKEHIYLTGNIECDLVQYIGDIRNVERKDVENHHKEFHQVLLNAPKAVLPGIFDEWSLQLRVDIQKRLVHLAERLSIFYSERNEYIKAAECIEDVIEYDCINESFYERLIHLYEKLNHTTKLEYWKQRYYEEYSF